VFFLHLSADSPFTLTNKATGFCLVKKFSRCLDIRWTTNDRLFVTTTKKCLGAQGKTVGSEVSLYDCDDKSDLQKWECRNETLLALKGQQLYIEVNPDESIALSRTVGPNNQLTITGTASGACTRTYRELYTIEGNAFGKICMFPFLYKDRWYGDCTIFDSSSRRPWCAIGTKYEHEQWGYCPTTSTEHWAKNIVSGSYYQLNTQSALTWAQAEVSCKQQGASLLSVVDPNEQAVISALLGASKVKLWIGLVLDPEHGWQWSDTKPFRYVRWDTGNPLPNPGHNCALLDSAAQHSWQSSSCSKKNGYICYKAGAPPAPPQSTGKVLLYSVLPSSVEQGFCSSPWIPYNGHCFHLQRVAKSWADAQRECRKEGGDLVSIRNVEDQSFVISQLGYASTDELWIGLNDRMTEGLFDWSDHSPVTFTSWGFGKPAVSTDSEDCVLIRGENGNWADHLCDEKHGFICMKQSATESTGVEVDLDLGCKAGWRRHGSYCYFTGSETKTFDEAKDDCTGSGSYLADVSNGVDNAFLVSLVGLRPEKHFWLGLSNQKNIDEFVWTSGNAVSYTHWNSEMPGYEQGCVAMTTGILAGLWDLLPCTNREKYICKHLAEGAVLTPVPPTQSPPKCADGWSRVGTRNMCAKFFTGPRSEEKTWFEARDYCRAIGGDLLSIHSTTDLIVGRNHGKAWIGLHIPDPSTGYIWSDGTAVNYLHWQEGEPNNQNNDESCAEFRMYNWDDGGSWNDVNCESYNDWLCQIRTGTLKYTTCCEHVSKTFADYNTTSDGWLQWRGNQYYVNRNSLSMEDARHFCKQSHGDLVSLTSKEENNFIWKQLSRSYGSFYIGLSVDLDGSFWWMDGTPVGFQRWDENQPDPNKFDENCVMMSYYMGFWRTCNCGQEHQFICKRGNSAPVNTTAAPTAPQFLLKVAAYPSGPNLTQRSETQTYKPERASAKSKCYNIISNQKATWEEARGICINMRGNLVSIPTRRVQAFLITKMAEVPNTNLWIGLNSIGDNGFYWTDGKSRRYTNWGYSEDCVVMTSSPSLGIGKWLIKSCNETYGFVCLRNLEQSITPKPEPKVPDIYVSLGNDSIKAVTKNMTWEDAKKSCESDNANLASLRNEWTQAYVELLAMNLNAPVWIGLNKQQTSGYFKYIDGWNLNFAGWAEGEPVSNQPCVYVDVDGKWKTAFCNQTMNSVCIKSIDVPPTESTNFPGICPEETNVEYHQSYTWLPFKGHCYLFITDEIEWADAASSCVRHGGVLASIEDTSEQEFIKSNVEIFQDSHSSFWIGLYKTHKGTWMWLDKTVLDYTNWAPDEPDNDFAEIGTSDGTWRTGRRWHDRAYICETPKVIPVDSESKPEPHGSQDPRSRVHTSVIVVLVIIVTSTLIAAAFFLYKKSPRSLPTFDNPLYFDSERSQPDVVDTNKLIENAENYADTGRSSSVFELYSIGGNAQGRVCMFPFMYKNQWYSDCSMVESHLPWCAVETRFDHEIWGLCPTNSKEHWKKHITTGVSYQLNTQSALTWPQAEASCKQQMASLLSVTDPHEQAYIAALLGGQGGKIWTGLIQDQEHGWQWSNGQPYRYLNWDSGHPLPNPGHNCAVADPAVQYAWQSSACTKKLGYICYSEGTVARPTEAAEAGFCSSPWIPYNGHCFHLHRTNKTWSDAQRECRKEGGDLVSIRNVEDQSFVISQLGYASTDELWIGLNDRRTEGLFDWTDHSPVTFTSWEFGEPAIVKDQQDCVVIRGANGNWADRACEEKHGFICMKTSASEPSGDEVEQNVGCKTGWKRHGSYCYFVGTHTKTFDEAKHDCKSSDSYLADVSNGVDNAFLVSLVGLRPEKHFWLGLSNQRNIDEFLWTNTDTVKFTHWNAQMPGHQQGCVAMKTGIFAGLWDVLPCTNREKYICKHLAEGAVLTPVPPTQSPLKCAEGWTPMHPRKYCFKLFSLSDEKKRTWYEARDYCRAIRGDLLSIHNMAELLMLPQRYDTVWIGLSAPDTATGYVWSDGSPVQFQHWEDGEPNNVNNVESCAEISLLQTRRSGSWNDVRCETHHGWLCQIRAGVTPSSPPGDVTPDYNETSDGWLEWRGSQYYFNQRSMAMDDARRFCQEKHGDLVSINSEAESVFLWKQVSSDFCISGSFTSFWIGLTIDFDGSYEWMDGSQVLYQKWSEGQPDFKNFDENCAIMEQYTGFWHDYNCGFEHASICKRSGSPPVNTTVAPTVAPTGGCPTNWKKFHSKCYRIDTKQNVTWDEGRKQCQKMGGNLASISSRHVEVFLMSQMAETPTSDLWIGLHSLHGNQFVWTDGRKKQYVNVALNKNCAVINIKHAPDIGKWGFRSCNDTNGFICLKNVDPTLPNSPEPTTSLHYEQIANDSIKVVTQQMSWDAAKKHCEGDGANLASIRNVWSQAYIEMLALNLKAPLWIGLNKAKTNGYFKYIDGWRLSFSSWGRNEPSGDKPCVYMDVDGKWKTAACNQTMNSVCMKSTDIPPTESSIFPGVCPDDPDTLNVGQNYFWQPFKGYCYIFFTQRKSWADASSSCVQHGGSLASIEDSSEQKFIQSTAKSFEDSFPSFWIGLYKTHKEEWLWLDKTVMDYTNWVEGQPEYHSHGVISTSNGTWKANMRFLRKPYICKTPKGKIIMIFFIMQISVLPPTPSSPPHDSPFQLTNKDTGFCLVKTNNHCSDIRWTTGNRLLVHQRKKCLGAQGKSVGSEVSLYDCDENSELQKWECRNETVLALKGQELYIELTADSTAALSKTIGPNNHLTITGTTSGACARTHREFYAIGGNAAGRLCMFPFHYKDQWYSDCTTTDSTTRRLWCAVETKYESERWGYCPITSKEDWTIHPTTGAYYQLNTESALTWPQAETSCKQQGASLLSITDPHEQAYISVLLGTGGNKVWSGLILDPEHGWKWSNRMPYRYLKWDSGHPLPDPGHNCAILEPAIQYGWQSSPCTMKLGYICYSAANEQSPTQAVETGFCSRPWIPYNGHCFYINRTEKTWSDAQRQCRSEGGDLVSLQNVEDQSFVISQLGYATNDELWIGLNDRKTEGLFDWIDHSPVSFTSWEFGKPAASTNLKDCVLIRGENGNWADRMCEEKHDFICMKMSASQPTGNDVQQDDGCKTWWRRHGSYCYFIGAQTKTFDEAKDDCTSSGSYLADVSNGVDNAFLVSLVGLRPEKHFWLGLSNQRNVGEFVWTNTDTVKFTHWNAQMPGHQQGCVAMKTGIFAGLWDVLPCTNREKYICKHLAEGAVLTPVPPTQSPLKCAEGWTPLHPRKYCFKLFTRDSYRAPKKRTWYEARDYCRAVGGDLLSIHSEAEILLLTQRYDTVWIGLSAPDTATGYVWSDGSPVQFQHWEDGEPNNVNNVESCVEISLLQTRRSGSWNDAHCETYRGWLCQIRAGKIRELSHFLLSLLVTQISTRVNSKFWIGLTVDLDKTYGWMDGSPMVFQRWDDGQPVFLNNDENCAVMLSSMGFWHDYSCGFEHSFICKRSASRPANATVPPIVHLSGGCPQNWKKFNLKCFNLIVDQKETWDGAKKKCQSMGGNLASIVSRIESAFLTGKMIEVNSPDLWIGVHNVNGNPFYWTDGRPMRYTNWWFSVSVCTTKKHYIYFLALFCIAVALYERPGRSMYHFDYEMNTNTSVTLDLKIVWSFPHQRECAVLTIDTNAGIGKWKKTSCNDSNGYICLKNVADPSVPDSPEPTTTLGYVQISNDSFKLVTQQMTWDAARKHCANDGATLARVENKMSQAYIEYLALNGQLWIGMNKQETGGYFKYVDGWHMTFTNWGFQEPTMSKSCVSVEMNGKWKTTDCNQNLTTICMKSIGGSLASIEDPPEQDFIQNTIKIYEDSHSSFWIGLYKTHRDTWLWLDKSVLDYTNWDDSQPYRSDYGAISARDGKWTASNKWSDKAYICKTPKELPRASPTAEIPLAQLQTRGHNILAGVLVIAVIVIGMVIALFLFKKSGRRLPIPEKLSTFDNPLFFSNEQRQSALVDTKKLVANAEEENIGAVITA
ncbi:hypothetical protein L3Q82_021350, partial [Scortum barcoo]